MPSSITLTVAHLPSSTSFFLSALQPLGIAYRGRSHNTIGFGSATDQNALTDFWITQEIPGVPAGAAHVAFSAPDRAAVQDFFHIALRAGGKIHGEPCVRDASGYYSAAVIDFDGNSIEAVYRPALDENKENVRALPNAETFVSRRPTKVPTNVSRAPSESKTVRTSPTSNSTPRRQPSGDVIENLFAEARSMAREARAIVAEARSQAAPAQASNSPKDNTNGVMGTLLGVAAGAALAYGLTNDHKDGGNNRRPSVGRSQTEPNPTTNYRGGSEYVYSTYYDVPPSQAPPIRMIDRDHDSGYHSTTRRGSLDTSSRSAAKVIEAAPPSSFRTHGQAASVHSNARPPPVHASTAPPTRQHSTRTSRRNSISSRQSGTTVKPTKPRVETEESFHTISYPPKSESSHIRESDRDVKSSSSRSKPPSPTSSRRGERDRDAPPTRIKLSRSSTAPLSAARVPLPPSTSSTRVSRATDSTFRTFETQRSKARTMDTEVTPADSISQVSSVPPSKLPSGMSRSTGRR